VEAPALPLNDAVLVFSVALTGAAAVRGVSDREFPRRARVCPESAWGTHARLTPERATREARTRQRLTREQANSGLGDEDGGRPAPARRRAADWRPASRLVKRPCRLQEQRFLRQVCLKPDSGDDPFAFWSTSRA